MIVFFTRAGRHYGFSNNRMGWNSLLLLQYGPRTYIILQLLGKLKEYSPKWFISGLYIFTCIIAGHVSFRFLLSSLELIVSENCFISSIITLTCIWLINFLGNFVEFLDNWRLLVLPRYSKTSNVLVPGLLQSFGRRMPHYIL